MYISISYLSFVGHWLFVIILINYLLLTNLSFHGLHILLMNDFYSDIEVRVEEKEDLGLV